MRIWIIAAGAAAAALAAGVGLAQGEPAEVVEPEIVEPFDAIEDAWAAGAGAPGLFAGREGPAGRGLVLGGLRWLAAADENGDRSVTRAELDGLRAEMFDWLDRNADGVLDIADRSPIAQRLAARGEAAPPRLGPVLGGVVGGLDADGDAAISREEYDAAPAFMFERLDADADAVVTPQEMDAALERRQAEMYWWREP